MLDKNSVNMNRSKLIFNNGVFSGTLELQALIDNTYKVTKNGKVIHIGSDPSEASTIYNNEMNRITQRPC